MRISAPTSRSRGRRRPFLSDRLMFAAQTSASKEVLRSSRRSPTAPSFKAWIAAKAPITSTARMSCFPQRFLLH